MFELYLLLYFLAVIAATYTTLKHHGLLAKPPIQQLEEKRILAEESMKALHGTACPLCGHSPTYVESVDFMETNSVVLVCEKCEQKTLWVLDRYVWKMKAPFKWTPALPTKLPVKVEAKKEEEEVRLVFESE